MAGIAGWITRGARRDEGALSAMLQAICHRGVDGLSGVVDRRSGRELVFAAQIADEASGVAVVLDGALANAAELKNALTVRGQRFASSADAEIVLRAYLQWDKECVRQLRGQFALAVWDGRRERLLLARDRFGEKPLYLYEKDGVVAFASEPKALRQAFPLEVDSNAVKNHLEGKTSGALYRNVRRLGPATQALWHFGRLIETRYWTSPDKEPYAGVPVSGAIEAFAGELEDAVRRRPADAVFLSGGLDSAALVAVASRNNTRLRTFTFGLAKDRNSELPAAAEVAKQFGTSHHEVVATPQELARALPEVVVMRDAPASRPSDVAVHLLCRSAEGVKRVLTGEGCDEVLGGYRRYIAARFKGNFRSDLYAAQTGPLPDEVLERTERVGAGAALEAQHPFLDHVLAETVSALPDDMRVRGVATKWILREAARGLLPKMGGRRHGGFRVRARDVMSNELLLEYLGAPDAHVRQYCDPATMLEEHVKGKKNHEAALWTLLNLEIWHRRSASG